MARIWPIWPHMEQRLSISMTRGVEGRVEGYCSSGEVRARENSRSMVGEEGWIVSEEKVRA